MKFRLIITAALSLLLINLYSQERINIGASEPIHFDGEYIAFAQRQVLNNAETTLITGGFTGQVYLNQDTLSSNNIRSGFFAVKDSLDTWKWFKKIDGSGYNQINTSIALDDGWLIAGVFTDTIQVMGSELIADSKQNVFVIKINNDGEYLWAKKFDIAPIGGNQFLKPSLNGSFLLVAEFTGKASINDSVFNAYNNYNCIIGLLNEDGEIEQTTLIKSNNSININAVAISTDGSLLIAGLGKDTVNIGQNSISSESKEFLFLANLDHNLQPSWINKLEGSGRKSITDALFVENGIVISGQYHGGLSYFNEQFPVSIGTHVFLSKLGFDGNMQWLQTIEGNSHKNSSGIVQGDLGLLYLIGSFRGTIEFLGEEYITTSYAHNLFIARYSHDGQPHWITFAKNSDNMQTSIVKGLKPGHLSFIGFNKNEQLSLFGHDIDTLAYGKVYIDLLDCDFAKRPKLPTDTIFCSSVLLDAGEGFEGYLWNNSDTGQTYETFSTGMVFLEVTDKYGCVVRDSVYVEVLPEFEIAISGVDMICPNDGNTMLWIDADAEISWSTGDSGQVIFAIEAGEYTATAINYAGCQAEASVSVSYFDSYPPVLGDFYVVSPEEMLELYPGVYSSYLWNGLFSDSVFVIHGDSYELGLNEFYLEVIDNNGCYYNKEFYVEIMEVIAHSTNANEDEGKQEFQILKSDELCDFSIFPNPGNAPVQLIPEGNDLINLIDSKNTVIEVLAWNAQGELLSKEILDNKYPWMILDGSSLNPGNYLISLVINGKVCNVKKVIVVN
jgi:hypothetical protein